MEYKILYIKLEDAMDGGNPKKKIRTKFAIGTEKPHSLDPTSKDWKTPKYLAKDTWETFTLQEDIEKVSNIIATFGYRIIIWLLRSEKELAPGRFITTHVVLTQKISQ